MSDRSVPLESGPAASSDRRPGPVDGVFLDGWSLADLPVHVVVSACELHVHEVSGRELRVWPLSGVHVDAMQEGHAYHLTHDAAPQELLVLRNPQLARQVLGLTKRAHVLPGGEHKLAYGLLGLLALALVLGGLYLSAPKLALFVARRIPLEQERALGGELEFLLELDKCDSAAATQLLRGLLAKLGERRALAYEVRIVQADMPNAFALPGGVILVTRGFLREAESADEIAGVLAHEVEHIEQRHVLAGALRGAMLTALWSLTLGDYSGLLVIDPSTAYRIANLEFSREDEQAADDAAVQRLHRAGFSHRGLSSFFERITKEHGEEGPAWLSTHPSTRARITALRGVRDVALAQAPFSAGELAVLRETCPD